MGFRLRLLVLREGLELTRAGQGRKTLLHVGSLCWVLRIVAVRCLVSMKLEVLQGGGGGGVGRMVGEGSRHSA